MRAGDSAELIAAETDWPLDKVLRYAEPRHLSLFDGQPTGEVFLDFAGVAAFCTATGWLAARSSEPPGWRRVAVSVAIFVIIMVIVVIYVTAFRVKFD